MVIDKSVFALEGTEQGNSELANAPSYFFIFHFLYKYSSISAFSLTLKLRLKNEVSPISPLMKLAGVAPFLQPIDNSALLKVEEVRVSLCEELIPFIEISICEPLVLERRIRFGVLILACFAPVTLMMVFDESLTLNL